MAGGRLKGELTVAVINHIIGWALLIAQDKTRKWCWNKHDAKIFMLLLDFKKELLRKQYDNQKLYGEAKNN